MLKNISPAAGAARWRSTPAPRRGAAPMPSQPGRPGTRSSRPTPALTNQGCGSSSSVTPSSPYRKGCGISSRGGPRCPTRKRWQPCATPAPSLTPTRPEHPDADAP